MTELPDRLEPSAPPTRSGSSPLSVEGVRGLFDSRSSFTVGLREELLLLEPATLELASETELTRGIPGVDQWFSGAARQGYLELRTPVCGNAVAAGLHLAAARLELYDDLEGNVALAAAGTHPFSTAWGQRVATEQRTRRAGQETPLAAPAHLPCGFRVHVAVPGADRALAVFNAARSYLPELAALAANSPFLDGRDTGLASMRSRLGLACPRAGIPPSFATWDELVAFVEWGRRAALFPDGRHLWWDLCPNLTQGTLELRVADAQTRLEDAAGIAAVSQALLVWLAERYDEGEQLQVHRQARIAENAWRAASEGPHGRLLDLDTGDRVGTRQRISDLVDAITPCAERLGTTWALLTARALLADNGADRQRYVAAREGLRGLVAWLAEETVGSPREYLERRG